MAARFETLQPRVHAGTDVQVVAATGELDLSTAPALCLEVQRAAATAGPPQIVVDLRSVDFTDATGLRALICAAQELRALSGALAVVATRGSQVDRLLTLTGAREFLAVTRTPQDAIAAVHRQTEIGPAPDGSAWTTARHAGRSAL